MRGYRTGCFTIELRVDYTCMPVCCSAWSHAALLLRFRPACLNAILFGSLNPNPNPNCSSTLTLNVTLTLNLTLTLTLNPNSNLYPNPNLNFNPKLTQTPTLALTRNILTLLER